MGKYTDIVKSLPPATRKKGPVRTVADEPVVPFDQIGKIVDIFDAKFLGVKPKGWIPN
jgi:hypothetical protein